MKKTKTVCDIIQVSEKSAFSEFRLAALCPLGNCWTQKISFEQRDEA